MLSVPELICLAAGYQAEGNLLCCALGNKEQDSSQLQFGTDADGVGG